MILGLVSDVKRLGYDKAALKTENDPANIKLLQEALRQLRVRGLEQTMEEHSPEYDPRAHGIAEVGVKLLTGHFWKVRTCIESRLGHRIPVSHPLIAWMIRHAASLITWCAKGHDG